MKNKHLILTTAVVSVVLAGTMFASRAFADGDCVTQYGGSQYGTPCAPNDLVINKEVQKPGAQENGQPVYVENLSITDASASAGTYLSFRLTVKNTSGRTFDPVEVKDIFPPFMNYVSGGPSGTVYDKDTRTMTAKLSNLIAGESRTLYITGKIDDASSNSFPSGKSDFCVVNTAQVRSDNRFNEDTAQVCIQTPQVKGVSTLPKAGSNSLLLIIPSLLLGAVGITLTKKSS